MTHDASTSPPASIPASTAAPASGQTAPLPAAIAPIDQATLWNGRAGQAWVETQSLLDGLFTPFSQRLIAAVEAHGARTVLDVGCGTGGTTLAIAGLRGGQGKQDAQGGSGRCLGIDISAPMIALARERAQQAGLPVDFVVADAQTHAFAPGGSGGFDMAVSRFGVMFFDDPVRAFENLRHALKPGGALHCQAWRSATDNPFMTTAERAGAPLLPAMPARPPGGPGQFAFADRQHVADILQAAGWQGIDIQPIDVACTMPERELARYVSWLGPVGIALQSMSEPARQPIVAEVLKAFSAYVQGGEVRFNAACWSIEARA